MANEQFQSILDSIKKDNKIESDEQFQAALKQENMTLADLRKNLERQMICRACSRTRCSARSGCRTRRRGEYYDAHKSEFTSPQTITLREIFVSVPGDGTTLNVGRDEEAQGQGGRDPQRASPAKASKNWPPIFRMRPRAPTPA